MRGRVVLLALLLGLGLLAVGGVADTEFAVIENADAICGGGEPGEPCNCGEGTILAKFIRC